MSDWTNIVSLDSGRNVRTGSTKDLVAAIRRGADLRILTDFRHNEHIDTSSANPELVREVSEFRVTYLIEDRWAAAIMSLRQPVSGPEGFGPRPSMSFFMYNQDGQQAIARPYLDGSSAIGEPGPSIPVQPPNMPKYHTLDAWDAETNAPSSNFIYDFEIYDFLVRDDWQEVLSHGADGSVVAGSLDALTEAFRRGREVKVGLRGLCADLKRGGGASDHEVFVQTGSNYHYTERGLFFAGTHPVVRVSPSIPMRYTSRGWDFGWLFVRTDGFVQSLLYDPYTLKPRKQDSRHEVRWFVK
jgi:hypothetical protein